MRPGRSVGTQGRVVVGRRPTWRLGGRGSPLTHTGVGNLALGTVGLPPRSKPLLYHRLLTRLRADHSASLVLSFLICKMELVVTTPTWVAMMSNEMTYKEV